MAEIIIYPGSIIRIGDITVRAEAAPAFANSQNMSPAASEIAAEAHAHALNHACERMEADLLASLSRPPTMPSAYARVVLFLIRPALAAKAQADLRKTFKMFCAEQTTLDRHLSRATQE